MEKFILIYMYMYMYIVLMELYSSSRLVIDKYIKYLQPVYSLDFTLCNIKTEKFVKIFYMYENACTCIND